MKPLVLFHGNCTDGFASAWVARRAMPDAELIPVQYGQPPPDVRGRDVYIIDFSYKRPVMRQILSDAHKAVVLDHHVTAEAELADIVDEFVMRPDLIANRPGSELPVVHFDMAKCGARLAWEYFNPDEKPPFLIELVEDRDLWKFELPESKALSAWLASMPKDFEEWDGIAERLTRPWFANGEWWYRSDVEELIECGEAILRYQDQLVSSICKAAREIEMDGHRILAVNTSVLFSEVAGKLAEDRPFGAAWFQRSDGRIQWSLRSRDGGIDVSEVAKKRGGGGHRNSSGYEV